MPVTKFCRNLLLAGVTLVSPVSVAARAQVGGLATTLVGMTRDSSGRAVPNVEVWLRGTDLYTHTNEAGGFRFPAVREGAVKMTVRRLGFEQATVDLQLSAGRIDSVVIVMSTVATRLPGVTIEEEADSRSKRLLAGFWDRRKVGNGHFVTHDEIMAMNAHNFTDLVRQLPGVRILSVNGRQQVRFSRDPGIRGDCPPLYWVDGIRVEGASGEEFPPGDVEAIEVYNGPATTPPQFTPRTVGPKTCGTVVVWTRLPGTGL